MLYFKKVRNFVLIFCQSNKTAFLDLTHFFLFRTNNIPKTKGVHRCPYCLYQECFSLTLCSEKQFVFNLFNHIQLGRKNLLQCWGEARQILLKISPGGEKNSNLYYCCIPCDYCRCCKNPDNHHEVIFWQIVTLFFKNLEIFIPVFNFLLYPYNRPHYYSLTTQPNKTEKL